MNKYDRALSGPLVMQLGYILFGIVPVLVAAANRAGWSAASTVVARFIIACICGVAVARVIGQSLKASRPRVLFYRGFLGGTAVVTYFLSVTQTGAGMGALLNNTHAIWANVLAVLVLRQRPARGFWAILLLASVGLWLVIDPTPERLSWGVFWGVLSGILAGGAILCVKELRKTDNASTILFGFSVVGLLCGLPFLIYERLNAPTGIWGDWTGLYSSILAFRGRWWASELLRGWMALLGVGIFSFIAQFLFTQGYKKTSVQLGTILSLTTPVIASAMGRLFLDEPLSPKFVVGAALTLTACAMMGMKEQHGNISPD